MRKSIFSMIAAFTLSSGVIAQDTEPDPADTTAPEINLVTPAVGSTVTSRTVTISGTATDATGVTEVRYRVERSRRWRKAILTSAGGTDTTFVFNARLPKRSHARIYVRAVDAAGNESDTIGRKYIINR